jgi:hypothetical protein
MNKDEIFNALEESREQFLDLIDNLSEEQLLTPGVEGEWSLRDILVHLARWEAELVKLLWQVRQEQRPTTVHFSGQSTDEINDRWQLESRGRPLERVLEDFHGVRAQTQRRLEEFSDRDLTDPTRYRWLEGQPLWERVGGDSFEHERKHAAHVREWLSRSK